ncbi:hypothetical protein INR79_24305 [Vibrio sp. SCSIO 43132]|uniref:hypothetical protein n=1 Tax=Vibrio sp. SCSIO 43132 TaxID=2779363 RepID=UPI001CA8EB0F|nr:hypothetical protein [Vibrio sp. SCSIO 43132]UAB72383.1 hypothetical protein INR79_24305 [Vibrio sp. SCSIO 43132]
MTVSNKNPILGYIACPDCLTPKSIRQGTGKRKAYYVGRCECGTDNRTATVPQQLMSQYKPLEEVEAELAMMRARLDQDTPKESDSSSTADDSPKGEPTDTKPLANDKPKDEQNSEPPKEESKLLVTTLCVGIGSVLGWAVGKTITVIRAAA